MANTTMDSPLPTKEFFSSVRNSGDFSSTTASLMATQVLRSLSQGLQQCPSPRYYDWNRPTEDNYRSEDATFHGHYKEIRQRLDYSYHSNYTQSRQSFQDIIIDSMLQTTAADITNPNEDDQWIVFTAGVMGAGKTHSCRLLQQQGKLPMRQDFVKVDPDELRCRLPEYTKLVEESPERAGAFTQKEAGMLAEMLTEVALDRGRNVLVDGSLCDSEWYMRYFCKLRRSHPKLHIGIIHVTAPVDIILERVQARARLTGRVIPLKVLMRSMEKVPQSVQTLRNHADFFLEILNDSKPTCWASSSPPPPPPLPAQKSPVWKTFRKDASKQVIAVPAT